MSAQDPDRARPRVGTGKHKWEFRARFRRGAFGWRSPPAMTRIRQALAEIRKVAKKDPVLGAEGAVAFLERVSPAIEHVDGSSGAIGAAVNGAVAELAPIIGDAPADAKTRGRWLERLWKASEEDGMAYLDRLGESWGELCGSPETASEWADRLMGGLVREWESERGRRVWFRGTSHCLSALVAAGRYDELLELLERAPFDTWMYRQFGMQALVAQGRKAEAIKYAEAGRGRNDNPAAVARQCEALLLSMGLTEEAYRRYGIAANPGSTYLATFRAVRRKYPHKAAGEILADLVATTPGKEGKWFAAAKDAGLYDEAVALATRTPSDPKTLARAARDFAASEPEFAVSAGLLALHWLVEGYGYEITGSDVWAVYRSTMAAADRLGTTEAVRGRVRAMVAAEATRDRFVAKALGRELGL